MSLSVVMAIGLMLAGAPGVKPATASDLKQLHSALKSPQRSKRLETVRRLSQQHKDFKPATRMLVEALSDKDSSVRSLALQALQERPIVDFAIYPMIENLLKTGAPEVQAFSLRAVTILRLDDPSVGPQIIPFLKSPSPLVRIAALRAIQGTQPSGAFVPLDNHYRRILRTMMTDTDRAIRREAIGQYSSLQPADPVVITPLLFDFLKSPLASDRAMGADKLSSVRRSLRNPQFSSRISDQSIVAALLPLVRDPDATVRDNVLRALESKDSSDTRVLQAMVDALNDPKSANRRVAAFFFLNTRADITPYKENLFGLLRLRISKQANGYPDPNGDEARQTVITILDNHFGNDTEVNRVIIDFILRVARGEEGELPTPTFYYACDVLLRRNPENKELRDTISQAKRTAEQRLPSEKRGR